MSGIIMISSGSESNLQAALTYVGPVAAAVDAQSTGFRVRQLIRTQWSIVYCSPTIVVVLNQLTCSITSHSYYTT